MRIALLAPRMHVRGPLPKLTPLLAEALRRRGCDVQILPWGRAFEGELLPAKIVSRTRDVVAARRAIVSGRFPIVVVHTSHDWLTLSRDLVLTRAIRGGSRVVVLHFHGSQSPRLLADGSWLFKHATAALLSGIDGALVLSREEQEEWLRFDPSARVFVVRNPMESSLAGAEGREVATGRPPTILCVARLLEGKGVLDVVRALAIVRRSASCRLVLAGEGPEAGRIRALAEELRVGDSVELAGYVVGDELARLYRTADVFTLPTALSEGFPMVIQEALAFGLPIVTTGSRGQAHHLVDGRNAIFVPPRDAEALATALLRLLTDVDLRQEMAKHNRAKAREFEPDAVAAEYLAALGHIVAEKRGQQPAARAVTRPSSVARSTTKRRV